MVKKTRARAKTAVKVLGAALAFCAGMAAVLAYPAAAAQDAASYALDTATTARVEVFDGVLDLWPVNLIGTSAEREIQIDADLGVASGATYPTSDPDAPLLRLDRATFRITGLGGAATLVAGMDKPRWGAGRYRTLILSGVARPYEQVRADLRLDTRFGGVTYRRLAAKLEPNEDTFLLGQRLEYSPRPWFVLGATETAVVTGRFARYPVNWLPLWPYYLTQHLALHLFKEPINDDDNDNVALDATVRLGEAGSVYGELFVDDMPQTPDEHGVYQLGFLAGGTARLPIAGGIHLDGEYARVNNYTYTFQNRSKSYLQYGQPLGFALGPDADSLIVMARKQASQAVEIGLGAELRRHGPGRVGDVWEEIGWEEGRKRSFLYEGDGAPVEKTYLGRIQVTYAPAGAATAAQGATATQGGPTASGIRVESALAFGLRENAGNKAGVSAPAFELTTSVRWEWKEL